MGNSRLDNSELANHLIETKRKFLFDIKMKTTICLFLAATCIAVTLASPGHGHRGRPRFQPKPDLVDTAVGAGKFGTLVKLVQDLGLEQTLRNARRVAAVFRSNTTAVPQMSSQLMCLPVMVSSMSL